MTAERCHTQQVRSEEKIRVKGQSEELVLRVPAGVPWEREREVGPVPMIEAPETG